MNYRHLRGCLSHAVTIGVLVLAWGEGARAQTQQDLPKVYVDAEPIAELPRKPPMSGPVIPGMGLCGAFRPTMTANFPGRSPKPTWPFSAYRDHTEPFLGFVNDFMDGDSPNYANKTQVTARTLKTPFDLAAQTIGFGENSNGDFVNTLGCPSMAGCVFPGSTDPTKPLDPFGARFRGFLAVKEEWQNLPLHIGFKTNSAVAMRIWPKLPLPANSMTKSVPYELVCRPADTGVADFRVTNQITFAKPGLYAVEILFANFGRSAHLEMAVLAGDSGSFQDFDEVTLPLEDPLYGPPLNFTLSSTMPEQFHQRLDGSPSFPGMPDICQQCPRQFAGNPNQAGNTCPNCMACNEAAVCQICNTDDHCGCSCDPCKGTTPYCVGDPTNPMDQHCVQCRTSADCNSGQTCINNQCKGFCPCCASPLFCTVTDTSPAAMGAKNCSECRTDSDCPGDKPVCDRINGRCVASIPQHSDDKDCGANAINCVESTKNDSHPRPYCLNGDVCVECRFDYNCKRGSYCRSGECITCTDDRHCGPNCSTCGLDQVFDDDGNLTSTSQTKTPYCYAPASVDGTTPAPVPSCVQCLTNEQCGDGGTCNPTDHTCSNPPKDCAMSCAAGQICVNGACAQCSTSSQCQCGKCTDGVCTGNCGDSTDCRSNQCCSQDTATCMSGRCKPGLHAGGGLCGCDATADCISAATDATQPPRYGALLGMMVALGMLLGLTQRQRLVALASRLSGGRA